MEEILNHLPKVHARLLRDVFNNMNEEKDAETKLRYSCYIRGYVNCLCNDELITYEEWQFLNHQTLFDGDC